MTRDDIQNEVRKLVGAPWVHQGRNPATGIDCIGVLVVVAKNLGLETYEKTDYSREPVGELLVDEVRKYFEEIPISEAREGDVLILRTAGKRLPTHVAILTKGDREYNLVHSIQISTVRKTVEEPYRRWMRLVTHAFRFKSLQEDIT